MRRAILLAAATVIGFATNGEAQAKRTKDNYVGCLKKEDYKVIVGYFVDHDNEAAAQMIADGDCVLLKPNLKVYIQDTAIWSGMIQIRLAGTRIAVWTAIEAVSD